jgi:hypothetical protein
LQASFRGLRTFDVAKVFSQLRSDVSRLALDADGFKHATLGVAQGGVERRIDILAGEPPRLLIFEHGTGDGRTLDQLALAGGQPIDQTPPRSASIALIRFTVLR